MIQKLLGGERKICISSEGFLQTSLSPCPSSRPPSSSSSAATSTTTTATVTASPNPEAQSLRCPRCDSTNTKFCYYNNYNLTQPRHFCKTCRRYWTKGGALRNVPIGGGCRKNKTASNISISSGKSSASAKLKSSFSISEIGKQIFMDSGFDHHELVWPPQNSDVLALLRTAQSPSSIQLGPINNGAQFSADPGGVASTLGMRSLSLDSYSTNQVPSVDASGTLWRSNQQPKGVATGGELAQNSGIQELLQRLKTSTSSYYGNHQPAVFSTNAFSSSSTNGSTILESAPVTGGDFGYFNSPFSWSDVATPSGAYP